MALQASEHATQESKQTDEHVRPPLDAPVFWKTPRAGVQPPTPLEEWKEEFRIAYAGQKHYRDW